MASILHAEKTHISRMILLPHAAKCLLCSSPFGDYVLFFVFILVLAILSTALLAAMQTYQCHAGSPHSSAKMRGKYVVFTNGNSWSSMVTSAMWSRYSSPSWKTIHLVAVSKDCLLCPEITDWKRAGHNSASRCGIPKIDWSNCAWGEIWPLLHPSSLYSTSP